MAIAASLPYFNRECDGLRLGYYGGSGRGFVKIQFVGLFEVLAVLSEFSIVYRE
jgi:hypothetical protein